MDNIWEDFWEENDLNEHQKANSSNFSFNPKTNQFELNDIGKSRLEQSAARLKNLLSPFAPKEKSSSEEPKDNGEYSSIEL